MKWHEEIVGTTLVYPGDSRMIPDRRFVGLDGDLCQAGFKSLGVSLETQTEGKQLVSTALYGIVKIEAGGPIEKFSYLTSDAEGRAVVARRGVDAVNGIALDEAKAPGNFIHIKFL